MNTETKSRIPRSYRAAAWRNTLPASNNEIGIGFDSDGKVIRLRLPVESARNLAETLTEFIREA